MKLKGSNRGGLAAPFKGALPSKYPPAIPRTFASEIHSLSHPAAPPSTATLGLSRDAFRFQADSPDPLPVPPRIFFSMHNKIPNILYLHSHDAGRAIEPLGAPVHTPALMDLARRGLCFRNAHTAAPTCSPSRSALLTGLYPHQNGMFGLAHRGFRLTVPDRHPTRRLRGAGYVSALAGIQHITEKATEIGYDEILCQGAEPEDVDHAVQAFFAQRQASGTRAPFFLDVGLSAPHRRATRFPFDHLADAVDSRYASPIGQLPDTEETRIDAAEFYSSVRAMDRGFGAVLKSLDHFGLTDTTLVIATTDHGPPFPEMKCTLRDTGTGVFLILAGPGVPEGKVTTSLVSNLDIYPTLLHAAGLKEEQPCEGRSLWPLIEGKVDHVRDSVHGEVTYHVAYEPIRSIRTTRWKYIRRFDSEFQRPILSNCDEGFSRKEIVRRGWLESVRDTEELYDLDSDPLEQKNLAYTADDNEICGILRKQLLDWMERTNDPLLKGSIPPAREGSHAHPGEINQTATRC